MVRGRGEKTQPDLRDCRESSDIRGQSGFCEHRNEGNIQKGVDTSDFTDEGFQVLGGVGVRTE